MVQRLPCSEKQGIWLVFSGVTSVSDMSATQPESRDEHLHLALVALLCFLDPSSE